MRAARVRTESMAQRLAKKPISEGFDLWDRGFILGAMRLFIFKAESSPPFQLGPCLDAMGHLLLAIQEHADAKEQFTYAAEKYDLIQQPLMAAIMRAKGEEAEAGTEAALAHINALLLEKDPTQDGAAGKDAKSKAGLGRAYGYKCELLVASIEGTRADKAQVIQDAIAAGSLAVQLGWDRVQLGHAALADAKAAGEDYAGALASIQQALAKSPNFLGAFERAIFYAKKLGDKPLALNFLDQAIALHPRSPLIREKAFLISENGSDSEALTFLEKYIANPPAEETEALNIGGANSICTLLKAKAAILADAGKLKEALEAAKMAVQQNPADEEAPCIVEDIQAVLEQQ